MKNLLKFLLVFCFSVSYAQSVSDFAYAYVPNEFSDFKNDKYGLTKVLSSELQKKGYHIQKGDMMTLEADACQMVYPEILNTSSFLRNKVKIEFRDCNKNLISSYEGTSMEKDFETGFPDALKKAMQKLAASNPKTVSIVNKTANETPKAKEVPVEKITKNADIPEQKEVVYPAPAKTSQAEVFINKNLNFNKINLSETQFILANPNSSTPFATFRESTKKGVYRVQLADGNSTLGYIENGNLVIEMPVSNGNFQKEVFSRK